MAKLSARSNTIEKSDGSVADLATAIDAGRQINKSYEVYLGLYQAITGPEERQKLFREFSPGFFDLIVIDECHRGSAVEDSAWRDILTYFSGGDANRPHGDAEGNQIRFQHRLFRRPGFLLLVEAGHPRWLPRAL
jgi:hypothetical protein